MPATASMEPTLEAGVAEVLRRHNAEDAFQTACEIARSCFPAMRSFHLELLEDPDEDDRLWVLLHFFLPPFYSWEKQHQEELRFHESMVTRVSRELNLLFGLHMDYLPEFGRIP